MNHIQILRTIDDIKKRSRHPLHTNFFGGRFEPSSVFLNQNAIVFLRYDRHVYRLYYTCRSVYDLIPLFQKIDQTLPICCEIITQNPEHTIFSVLENYFSFDSELVRLRCYPQYLKLSRLYQESDITFAQKEDVPFIFETLESTFLHYISHLPTQEELSDSVANQEVILVKEEHMISSFGVYKIQGKTGNFECLVSLNHNLSHTNAVINMCNSQMIHKNLVSSFLWIDPVQNKKLKRHHEKWGYVEDGLKNYIFINDQLKNLLLPPPSQIINLFFVYLITSGRLDQFPDFSHSIDFKDSYDFGISIPKQKRKKRIYQSHPRTSKLYGYKNAFKKDFVKTSFYPSGCFISFKGVSKNLRFQTSMLCRYHHFPFGTTFFNHDACSKGENNAQR